VLAWVSLLEARATACERRHPPSAGSPAPHLPRTGARAPPGCSVAQGHRGPGAVAASPARAPPDGCGAGPSRRHLDPDRQSAPAAQHRRRQHQHTALMPCRGRCCRLTTGGRLRVRARRLQGTPRSRHIFPARSSSMSLWRGTAERLFRLGLCHQECRTPSRNS
jgi:hypothetical protein